MKTILLIVMTILLSGCFTSQAERAEQVRAEHKRRRNAYVESHPKAHEKMKETILKGLILIGMTEEEVIASWGFPQKSNRSVNSQGVFKQWCYGLYRTVGYQKILYVHTYAYFQNGKLVSWQNVELK